MIIRGVIDILSGGVVRGIEGQRETYAPIKSRLTCSTAPDDIARALHEKFGLKHFYIADLDAIIHQKAANWKLLESWSNRGWNVWADLGITGPECLSTLPTIPGILEVIGTESWVGNPGELIGVPHPPLVLSMDTKNGALWGRASGEYSSPADCLRAWDILDIPDLLWMDLGKVGSYRGPTRSESIDFARKPARRIHAAGGVRGPEDLAQLEKDGFDGVLIASALHDGRLSSI
jgi:phosphoribosylformimino-5-aminoimidazole carboxamide ribotide isomerase